jgi:hypothetical protein
MSRTIAAIGTMTATAMVPPEDSPLDFDDESALTVASADLLDEEEVVPDEAGEYEYTELDTGVWLAVDVMNIVVGAAVPPVNDGVSVTTEV